MTTYKLICKKCFEIENTDSSESESESESSSDSDYLEEIPKENQ